MVRAIVIVVLVACAACVVAQPVLDEPPRMHFGPFIEGGVNGHDVNFQHLPGVPNCCPQFTAGLGANFSFGVHVDLPVDTGVWFGLTVLRSSLDATIARDEYTPVIVNGVLEDGIIRHEVNSRIRLWGAELHYLVSLGGRWLGTAGIEGGVISEATYTQQETITDPVGVGTFLDSLGRDSHSRVRAQAHGSIPGAASLYLAPTIGVRRELPLNRNGTLLLVPQLTAAAGVTPIASQLTWRASSLRIGASLEIAPREFYDERHVREEIDTMILPAGHGESPIVRRGLQETHDEERIAGNVRITTEVTHRTDTLVVPAAAQRLETRTPGAAAIATDSARRVVPAAVTSAPPKLVATLDAIAIDSGSAGEQTTTIVVQDERSVLMVPLLNHVFFAENSAEIPSRYVALTPDETRGFDERRVNDSTKLPTYHYLLNIVGKRMREHPSSSILVTGCNMDTRGEQGNVGLSRRRAEAVREYLARVWGIDGERIMMRARNLPERPALSGTPDAEEENRRVDIETNDDDLFAPVITCDTTTMVSPSALRFRSKIDADTTIISSSLTIDNSGTVLKTFTAQGKLPPIIDWRPDGSMLAATGDLDSLRGTLEVRDCASDIAIAQHVIPAVRSHAVRRKVVHVAGREVNRFGLLLFDVRSAAINRYNERAMAIIRDALTATARVTFRGYTDRLGEAAYNQQLALQRAQSAAAAVGAPPSATIEGIGCATTYDCTLPEGRMYTRTVDITVEGPLP